MPRPAMATRLGRRQVALLSPSVRILVFAALFDDIGTSSGDCQAGQGRLPSLSHLTDERPKACNRSTGSQRARIARFRPGIC